MQYNIKISPSPGKGEQWNSPEYVRRSREMAQSIESAIRDRAFLVRFDWGPPRPEPVAINYVEIQLARKADLLACRELLQSFPCALCWTIGTSADADSVFRALWVPLYIEGECVDVNPETGLPPEYPKACKQCGWGDASAVPDPYPVFAAQLPSASQTIFRCHNGILAAASAIVESFVDISGGEVDSGHIQVIGALDGVEGSFPAMRWMRPRMSMGQPHLRDLCQFCATCGRPIQWRRREVLGEVVDQWENGPQHMGRVGVHPWFQGRKQLRRPLMQDIAVSGAMFRRLYDLDIPGLVWPDDGVFVSLCPTDRTWKNEVL